MDLQSTTSKSHKNNTNSNPIPRKHQAQTKAYNRLLDKSNEEKTKCIKEVNRHEMVIQTEVLDHSPPREKGQQTSTNQGQWEQPQAQMIN